MPIHDRLKILNDNEIEELFIIPKIDTQDRELLFEITSEDKVYLSRQTIVANQVNYLLQVGYFRASRKFYSFKYSVIKEDVQYIINRHFSGCKLPKSNVSKDKHYEAQDAILKIYGYQRYNSEFGIELEKQAYRLSKIDLNLRFIFDELLHFCESKQIVRPQYSKFQKLVSKAVIREENRLTARLTRALDSVSREKLDGLIKNINTISELSLLKKNPKGFLTREMEMEADKRKEIGGVYQKSKKIILDLNISRHNIQYYADLCEYYDTYRLNEFSKKKSRLYMLCFIWQRFIKINDHLITFFIHKEKFYETKASEYAKVCVAEAKDNSDSDRKTASRMLGIVENDDIKDNEIRPKCYEIINKNKLKDFRNNLEAPNFNEASYKWEYYSKENGSIKRNLRTIFLEQQWILDKKANLKEAVEFAKKYFTSSDKTTDPQAAIVPLKFISTRYKKYITYMKTIIISPKSKRTKNVKYVDIKRFEMILYYYVASAVTSGNAFVADSVNYRSLENELIDKDRWDKEKNRLLKEYAESINTSDIKEILKKLETELKNLYRRINKRIKSGENQDIKIEEDKITWKLPYKKIADSPNNPYYEKFRNVNIAEVIDYTATKTNFYAKLSHILNKGSKTNPKPEFIKAYLVSRGEGIGHKKIAESSDVSYQSLTGIEGKFMRVDSLIEAGDLIIDAIAKLPIFKYYNLSDYGILASLDGQKIETKYQTIKARYSTKYFGYGRGVVSYSLIANHLPTSTKIIGANEHESHYVLDIVYNNTSDLNITAVSGDMHSVNRVNFAFMNLFNYDFMPRFTKFYDKANDHLVAFKSFKSYKNDLIKPAHFINKELIINEWDNIRRIMVSLARKEASQSCIIRKLSSYAKKNNTLKALVEYDKIIMSIYMLKYIDDIELRRNVHRALNRGEAFHQLRSALLQVSGKKILGRTDNSLEISNQCNRVLAGCIIFYNASLLSELLQLAELNKNESLAEKIKQLSPVAWQHISFIGNFTFSSKLKPIDIKELIKDALEEKEEFVAA